MLYLDLSAVSALRLIKVGDERKSSDRIAIAPVALDCIGLQIHMHTL